MVGMRLLVTKNIPRVVRVFISSTFRDMEAEREVIVKFVTPELSRRCRSRGVTLVVVDLRWGVTAAQAEIGEVIPTCLDEIDRCGYFLGLLGNRYGWVPESFSPAQLATYPWLSEYRGASLTELEMVHGALRAERQERALVFFRGGQASASGDPGADTGKKVLRSSTRLEKLKEQIRATRPVYTQSYTSPEELGSQALEALWSKLEQEFPTPTSVDKLDEELLEHESFAQSRFDIYIDREEEIAELTRHIESDGPPLVVYGESGIGKSALLSNWSKKYFDDDRDSPDSVQTAAFIRHFIGASASSSSVDGLLRRVIGELNRQLGLNFTVPDERSTIPEAFRRCLSQAALRGRVVILLDALDQLEDQNDRGNLAGLPVDVPANVRLIVSTASTEQAEAFTARGWSALRVEPLNRRDRERLLKQYLEKYGKRLDSERVIRIVEHGQTANPLFLRILLDELRVYGHHENLDRRINHYLTATDAESLFALRLERFECDYEGPCPGLVRDAFTRIWASRTGLAESELLQLLGSEGKSLPQSYWAPLYLAAESSFIEQAGALRFCHQQLGRAVERRYVTDKELCRGLHVELATFFEQQIAHYAKDATSNEYFMTGTIRYLVATRGRSVVRSVTEVMWQLRSAGSWELLSNLLGKAEFLDLALRIDRSEVHQCWTEIERHSPGTILQFYKHIIDNPSAYTAVLWQLAWLLRERGYLHASLPLYRHLAAFHSQGKYERESESGAILNLGYALFDSGELAGALEQFNRAEGISKIRAATSKYDAETLANCFCAQAQVYFKQHNYRESLQLFERARQLAKGSDLHKLQADCLQGIAFIRQDQGASIDELRELYEDQERLYLLAGQETSLAICRGNWGRTLLQFDREAAMRLFEKMEETYRALGLKEGIARALSLKASYFDEGWKSTEDDKAMALLEEAEDLYRAAENLEGVAEAQASRARILNRRGKHGQALDLLREHEYYLRRVGDFAGMAETLGRQIGVLGNRARAATAAGDVTAAATDYDEAEKLWAAIVAISEDYNFDGTVDIDRIKTSINFLRENLPDSVCERAAQLANTGFLAQSMTLAKLADELYARAEESRRRDKQIKHRWGTEV